MTVWRVGDLAVCVDASRRWEVIGEHDWYVRFRAIYRVVGVRAVTDSLGTFLGLDLAGDPDAFNPIAAWEADRFRKVEPAEPCFTEAMRSLRPKVEA